MGRVDRLVPFLGVGAAGTSSSWSRLFQGWRSGRHRAGGVDAQEAGAGMRYFKMIVHVNGTRQAMERAVGRLAPPIRPL
jgi:hypothetical protein